MFPISKAETLQKHNISKNLSENLKTIDVFILLIYFAKKKQTNKCEILQFTLRRQVNNKNPTNHTAVLLVQPLFSCGRTLGQSMADLASWD